LQLFHSMIPVIRRIFSTPWKTFKIVGDQGNISKTCKKKMECIRYDFYARSKVLLHDYNTDYFMRHYCDIKLMLVDVLNSNEILNVVASNFFYE